MTRQEDSDAILREAIGALEMPLPGIARWLDQLEHFYRRHGGERNYGECLALLNRVRAALVEVETAGR